MGETRSRNWAGRGAVLSMLVVIAAAQSDTVCAQVDEARKRIMLRISESPRMAAEDAARLANDECERRFLRRPFAAAQYEIEKESDSWRWGRLDVASPTGFSAEVRFRSNRSVSSVRVYYSADTVDSKYRPLSPARQTPAK